MQAKAIFSLADRMSGRELAPAATKKPTPVATVVFKNSRRFLGDAI
jgi:hypothetical protein